MRSNNIQADQEKISNKNTIELDFPVIEVSQLAQRESWRKEINRPIYHIHKWWAKRLGSVFRAIAIASLTSDESFDWEKFYTQQSFQDKVVLDPFMGSGTTLGEALKLGCKVIGCDINPVSTFIVRQALTKVTEEELRKAFHYIGEEVAQKIQQYYQTQDPETGELIPVLYYFWVKVVETPDGESIPLFSNYVFSKNAYPKKKPKSQIICPQCWGIVVDRFDSLETRCPSCFLKFNPQEGTTKGQYVESSSGKRYKIKNLIATQKSLPKHRMYAMLALRSNGEKIYLPVREEDLQLFRKAKKQLASEELPLPQSTIRSGYNTDQARGYNYFQWRDFFNERQLLCLGFLLRSILRVENREVRDQLLCLFSSTLEFNNLFCTFKGEGTGAVRHMFSHHILKPEKTPLENCVWGTSKSSGTFSTLFESRLIPAKRYLDNPYELFLNRNLFGEVEDSGKVTCSKPIDVSIVESWEEFSSCDKAALVMNGSSDNLNIPNESVDLVLTDPPYFDFIHYSELSDFFFAWLAPTLRNDYSFFTGENSSGLGEVQHNEPRYFAEQLEKVFSECCRVLKHGGLLVFSFHHSKPEGWAAIFHAVQSSGLRIVASHPVYGELSVSSPKSSTKDPITLDAILVCKKVGNQEEPSVDVKRAGIKAKELSTKLKSAGIKLSKSDESVILASQILANVFDTSMSFDSMKCLLEQKIVTPNNAHAPDRQEATC
ncbi:DNA methyltransferase [Vacuolonema iberomarrocanum]|uniref:DNA methyltransferase n=1 Tax=Vacuolonema iberomarrocanum TaxID=3454632 RepID=UPI0019FD766F|nr:DNA adenine methylase [filamentous cyanobacterium LEGE 07170]